MEENERFNPKTVKGFLEINDNLLETIEYNSKTIPIKANYSRLSDFSGGIMPAHWHKELEFIIVEEGNLEYYVNNRAYQLTKGQGIIVNTNRLHLGGPVWEEQKENVGVEFEIDRRALVEERDCLYAVLLLQPDTLRMNRQFEKKYIDPLLYDSNSDVFLLDLTKSWHREVIQLTMEIFYNVMEVTPYYELTCQSKFLELWKVLFENTIAKHGYDCSETDPMSSLKRMIAYIQENFQEKITLNDVAEAGMMCQSKCCRLFRLSLKQSPMEYLQNFRIGRGSYLLAHTDMRITDIALECGFHGTSYFTETFRKIHGITPKEYRKRESK